jgi:hypothetical protein
LESVYGIFCTVPYVEFKKGAFGKAGKQKSNTQHTNQDDGRRCPVGAVAEWSEREETAADRSW